MGSENADQNPRPPRVLDENFALLERVWVSPPRPDAEGSISILKCLEQSMILAKRSLVLAQRVWVTKPRPSATQTLCARTRLMHYQLKFLSKEPQVF